MIAMFKAIPLGIFLTLLVALFMGSGGTSGGMLHVFPFQVQNADLGLDFRLTTNNHIERYWQEI